VFDPVRIIAEQPLRRAADVRVRGHGADQHQPGERLLGEPLIDRGELGAAHEASALGVEL
jgi:hypothetical protein